jgi:hypothetical protein
MSYLLFLLLSSVYKAENSPERMNTIFSSGSQNAKKKRKSRTAFTNTQIVELEKRFLYQKYLSPADRDELANGLGLTGAQVNRFKPKSILKNKSAATQQKTNLQIQTCLPLSLKCCSRTGHHLVPKSTCQNETWHWRDEERLSNGQIGSSSTIGISRTRTARFKHAAVR